MTEIPSWLGRAWRIRAVILTLILGLLALALWSKAQETGGGTWIILGFPLVLGLAVGGDYIWLRRNHHRVNEWGLSKGRNARKRPM